MKSETRRSRQAEIEEVAFTLLEDAGFAATSMLAVAKAAKASNETLYRWYGDKNGLFAALVTRNTDLIRDQLTDDLATDTDAVQSLRSLGPNLLKMLLGPRAIALNRAAATDESGNLGALLATAGRETVLPVLTEVMERGDFSGTPTDLSALYVTLLVGDLQIRRITGAMEDLTPTQRTARATTALDQFLRLAAP